MQTPLPYSSQLYANFPGTMKILPLGVEWILNVIIFPIPFGLVL